MKTISQSAALKAARSLVKLAGTWSVLRDGDVVHGPTRGLSLTVDATMMSGPATLHVDYIVDHWDRMLDELEYRNRSDTAPDEQHGHPHLHVLLFEGPGGDDWAEGHARVNQWLGSLDDSRSEA